MISTVTYNGDGATRVFPVAFDIKGEDYVVVFLNDVAVSDRTKYDIINNSIVFNIADTPPIGTNNVEIVVASNPTEIADLNAPPSSVQTVLDNLTNINAVADNKTNIDTVASNTTNVTTVSNNIVNINSVATNIVPNLAEILQSDTNATIATTKATEASASATSASNSATTATNQATIATDEAIIATTKASEASASEASALSSKNASALSEAHAKASETNAAMSEANALAYKNSASDSATTAATQAGIATTKAVEASTSASNALASETMADKWANNPENIEVTIGKYSAYHWSEKAKEFAAGSAINIAYNNTISGLTAINAQEAIDELASEKAEDTLVVHKTGDETIGGVKSFTDGVKVQNQNVSPFSGFKNYIINGNFDVWQRGTSQTTADYGSDDRWSNDNYISTKTHSRVSCTDTERALFNASYFSRTVSTYVSGSNSYVKKIQSIENITRLAGKTVTISFWAKSDSNKKMNVQVVDVYGSGGTPTISSIDSYVNFGNVDLTSTWTKYKLTATLQSLVGKTLGTDGVHTSYFRLDFGFTFSADRHEVTLFGMPAGQSGTFDIAQVQLEEGSVATPFEQRHYGLELSLCQRYYEAVIDGSTGILYGELGGSSGNMRGTYGFKVTKRVTPTITYSSLTTSILTYSKDFIIIQRTADNAEIVRLKISAEL